MKLAVTGNAQLAKAIRAMCPDDARGALTAMLMHGVEPVVERMSELAPDGDDLPGEVDLSASIGVQKLKKFDDADLGEVVLGDGEAAVAVGPSTKAFHGFFQEYGTAPRGQHPGHGAQPFARPAFDETHDEVLRRIGDRIADFLRNQGQRSTTGRGV